MKRLAELLLIAATGLFVAAPALAAKHVQPAAMITVDQADLHYGDRVTFSVTTNATPTWVNTACVTDFGTSYGGTLIYSATSYTADEVRLTAPNWPSGGATCSTVVKLITAQTSDHWKVIGSASFLVAP